MAVARRCSSVVWVVAVGVLGAVGAVGGCGGSGKPTEFSDRVALPSCGVVDARDGVDSEEQTAIDCLTGAQASARSGELVLRLNSTEGELLVRYLRVVDDGSGEAFYDNHRDARGPDDWTFQGGCRTVAPSPIELVAIRDCETSTTLR
jgi:hypothetical protein